MDKHAFLLSVLSISLSPLHCILSSREWQLYATVAKALEQDWKPLEPCVAGNG